MVKKDIGNNLEVIPISSEQIEPYIGTLIIADYSRSFAQRASKRLLRLLGKIPVVLYEDEYNTAIDGIDPGSNVDRKTEAARLRAWKTKHSDVLLIRKSPNVMQISNDYNLE